MFICTTHYWFFWQRLQMQFLSGSMQDLCSSAHKFFISLILSPFHNTMTANSILLLITIWTVCNWECKRRWTLSDLKGFCLIVDKVCSSAGVSVTRSPNAHRFGSTCAYFVSSPSSPLLFPCYLFHVILHFTCSAHTWLSDHRLLYNCSARGGNSHQVNWTYLLYLLKA